MFRVQIFGTVRITDDSGVEVRLPTLKGLEILLWLSLHGTQSGDRKSIAADLWPGEPEDQALAYLRDNLYRARRVLKELGSGTDAVVSMRDTVSLKQSAFTSDWADFWRLLESTPQAEHPERLDNLLAALALFQPPQRARWCSNWVEPIYKRAQDAFEAAAHEAIDLAESLGDNERALAASTRYLNVAPSSAWAIDHRIRLLVRMGALAEARALYDSASASGVQFERPLLNPWEEPFRFAEDASISHRRSRGSRIGLPLMLAAAILFGTGWFAFHRLIWQEPSSMQDATARLDLLKQASGLARTSKESHLEQARLISWISKQCWQKMWGPEEPLCKSVIAAHWTDVEQAFEWSMRNDPKLALSIVGNGHRIFDMVVPPSVWHPWIERALAASHGDSIDRGRALCGVALADWDDAPRRGFDAATEAIRIFHNLDATWDEANACRHAGICDWKNIPVQTQFYLRALALFRKVETTQDARGTAMTLESLAERGTARSYPELPGTGMFEARAGYFVAASQNFRALGNERLAIYNCQGAFHEIRIGSVPVCEVLKQCRAELAHWASVERRGLEAHEAHQLLAECVDIDCVERDNRALAADLGDLLADPSRAKEANVGVYSFLMGAYCGACHQAGLTPSESFSSPKRSPLWYHRPSRETQQFRFGLAASDTQISMSAAEFCKPLT